MSQIRDCLKKILALTWVSPLTVAIISLLLGFYGEAALHSYVQPEKAGKWLMYKLLGLGFSQSAACTIHTASAFILEWALCLVGGVSLGLLNPRRRLLCLVEVAVGLIFLPWLWYTSLYTIPAAMSVQGGVRVLVLTLLGRLPYETISVAILFVTYMAFSRMRERRRQRGRGFPVCTPS